MEKKYFPEQEAGNQLSVKSVAIYGAQMVAVSVYYAIKELYPDVSVKAFIVSSRIGNPISIDGIPVILLEQFKYTDIEVLIAAPENHHMAIIGGLEKKHITDYVSINSSIEAVLMKKYYEKTGDFSVLSAVPLSDKRPEISVYQSKFHKDQPLKGDYAAPDWVHAIQAGAELSDVHIAGVRDNEGDNISIKNGNYSELTAMYWIGKHAESEYLGLFHYRRILAVTEDDLYRLGSNKIDVILPYPTIHYPNILEHHRRYLGEEDWGALILALTECAPAYAAAFPKIFKGRYFYNYNMLIAKKAILKEYCNWLFPILERIEKLSNPKGSERSDRYLGYLGENLTTLYFMYHQKDFKIAHTGRIMLT